MKNYLLIVAVHLFFANAAFTQQADTARAVAVDTTNVVPPPVADTIKVVPPPAAEPAKDVPPPAAEPQGKSVQSKIYYGGYVGATFGDYSTIEVSPMIGYHFNSVLSGGLRFKYEYVSADMYGTEFTASNYGGSVFSYARVHPNIYLQAEFEYMSYEWPTVGGVNVREWVPFLYLGGGAVKQLSGNVSLVASVLFDVLQDENSPYNEWEPMFSVGIIAGF